MLAYKGPRFNLSMRHHEIYFIHLPVLKKLPYLLIASLLASCSSSPPEKISLVDLFISCEKTDSIDYYLKEMGFEKANGGDAKKNTSFFQKNAGDSSVAYYSEGDKFTYGRFTIKNFKPEQFGQFEQLIMAKNKLENIQGDITEDGKSYHNPKQFDLYVELDSTNLFMEVFLNQEK